jgi:hypothetical protein
MVLIGFGDRRKKSAGIYRFIDGNQKQIQLNLVK